MNGTRPLWGHPLLPPDRMDPAMPLLDALKAHPITLPDGTVVTETVQLKAVLDHPRIEAGEYTYFTHADRPEETAGILAPYTFPFSPERLVIGKFGQIARGSYFITSSANHPMHGFTTFPFRIFDLAGTGGYQDLPFRDTVVGHDVWIGHGSVIMPGVTIGSGAIIAAASVVTRDVEPYTIVGGNPARPIRKRFDDRTIAELLDMAWWDWPADKIEAHVAALESGDIAALRRASRQG